MIIQYKKTLPSNKLIIAFVKNIFYTISIPVQTFFNTFSIQLPLESWCGAECCRKVVGRTKGVKDACLIGLRTGKSEIISATIKDTPYFVDMMAGRIS